MAGSKTREPAPWRDANGTPMQFAEGIAEFVTQVHANRDAPEGLEAIRLSFEQASARANAGRPSGLTTRNWFVAASGREIPIRLIRPQGAGPYATLLYFHGGGWVVGSLDSHDRIAAEIAHRAGVQVILVHYRRAPENPYPAAIEDGWEVLQWALRHGDLHAIDTARLGVAGDSAGAHIATALTHKVKVERSTEIALRCQVLIYPAIEPDFTTPSYHENAEAPCLTAADMRRFWQLYMPDPGETDPLARPALASDKSALPPALIVTAQHDPLRDDGVGYAAALKQAGNHVELHTLPGMVHSFLRAIDMSQAVRDELDSICAFVGKHM